MRRRSYETAEAFTTAPANELRKRSRARNIAAGLCEKARSHGPALPGRTQCAACTEKKAAQDHRRHVESIARRRSS
jgi:hypothetical protein